MMALPRVSAWLGAARGDGGAWYVVEIGRLDARDEWQSETLEGRTEGDEMDAAREGLLAALATLGGPSRVGVAVVNMRVAKNLRALVHRTSATRPHEVSITCVSATAPYATAAVASDRRARGLSAALEGASKGINPVFVDEAIGM
jgi:hypothetical protein